MTALARVRAPASTANLGPGFDCVAVALELWNELEVSDGGDSDPGHLAVRADEKIAPASGKAFSFIDRVPRERGLGSSAAVIALGLVAAAEIEGRKATPEELLTLGLELEGHPDNLASALAGGACLTWKGKIARLAAEPPAVPIAVVPEASVSTVASGSRELFREALTDRLHEPYRKQSALLLARVRAQLPEGAHGATLSGSGPSVIVWAEPEAVTACVEAVHSAHPDAAVYPLAVSRKGAHAL